MPPRAVLEHARPLGFAHRGGSKLWPENTLEAFRGAVDAGLHFLETDLHMSRDGVIVVHHDADLDRTTSGSGPLRERTLAELRTLDAAQWFSTDGKTYPRRGEGIRIPTLEELIELSPAACFNVEIKQADPPMEEQVWSFIDERGLHDRFIVAAEQDSILRRFRRASGGRVATGASRREVTAFWAAVRARVDRFVPTPFDALQVPVRSGRLLVVEPRFLRAAHRRGVQVHVWTIDEEPEMRRLLDLGVDGLMTDRPDRLARVLGMN